MALSVLDLSKRQNLTLESQGAYCFRLSLEKPLTDIVSKKYINSERSLE